MSSHDTPLAAYLKLIATPEPPRLGPQTRASIVPTAELNRALAGFFAERKLAARLQPYLKSAALLWHDQLDDSHTISQSIESPEGSWLHGIMHRREPDYGNAKYWFHRVGQHDAFAPLAERVAPLLHNDGEGLTGRLIENGEWNPFAFIDECQRVETSGREPERLLLRQIQAAEFETLVAHLFATL